MVAFGAALFSFGQMLGAVLQHRVKWCPSSSVDSWTVALTLVQIVVFVLLPIGVVKGIWMFAEVLLGLIAGTIWWRFRRECRTRDIPQ